ncbi:MAG: hypothetical protein PHD76_11055 [Methylacidiphilales bacterium]|nr:hypothetical protein [Candidatus Methylacidiphilales bacterium]
MNYVVVDSQGNVLRSGTCQAIDFQAQAGTGETVMEGTQDQYQSSDAQGDLATIKTMLKAQVDAIIETRRQALVTPGTVMQLVYGMKKLEAYVLSTLPTIPDQSTAEVAFPLLAKEAAARGIALQDMAALVDSANEAFRTAMADLEVLRFETKAAIDAAADEAAARTALSALLGPT